MGGFQKGSSCNGRLGGHFDICFFFARGGGRGNPRRWEGGRGGRDRFLLRISRGGGPSRTGGRGREGVCGEGGLNIFFGAEMSTK